MIPTDSFVTDAIILATDTVTKEHTQKIRLDIASRTRASRKKWLHGTYHNMWIEVSLIYGQSKGIRDTERCVRVMQHSMINVIILKGLQRKYFGWHKWCNATKQITSQVSNDPWNELNFFRDKDFFFRRINLPSNDLMRNNKWHSVKKKN